MNSKIRILGLALMLIVLFQANAQKDNKEKGWRSGNSVMYSSPVGNMEAYNYGLGVYGNVDYIFNKHFAARLDIGWNEFTGKEHQYIDVNGTFHNVKPSMSVWEFTAGARANVGIFYIEARGGYFTGVDSWGFVPAVGVRYKNFDLQGNFNIAGDYHWGGVRLAYYWGK